MLMAQVRRNKLVNVAVEDALHIATLHAGPNVLAVRS